MKNRNDKPHQALWGEELLSAQQLQQLEQIAKENNTTLPILLSLAVEAIIAEGKRDENRLPRRKLGSVDH